MQRDLSCFKLLFPFTVIFSEMVPRLLWTGSSNLHYLDKIRKRLNRTIRNSLGGLSYHHLDLEGSLPGLYRADLVNLSDVGLDIFMVI